MQNTGGQNSNLRLEAFDNLLNHIEASNWKSALIKGCRIYNVKSFNVEKLSPDKVRELYKRIHQRYQEIDLGSICARGQRMVFGSKISQGYSFGFCYLPVKSKTHPPSYTEDDWNPIALIFEGKSVQTLKFQYKSITNKKVTSWNQEQDELLIQMIQERNENNPNWNQISRDLFSISQEKYFKTSKQCRQHWNNYLNPKVLKSQWDKKQDHLLMKHVVEKGKQWSAISKLLEAKRTEHMVKNRFKSLVLTYSKEFNISKKHSESPTILQKILRRIKSELEEFQQSHQESFQSLSEEKLKEMKPEFKSKKSAFQPVLFPLMDQLTTIGPNSPAVFSPCQFGIQFSPNIFSQYVLQMPFVGLDSTFFQPTFYQLSNQDPQSI